MADILMKLLRNMLTIKSIILDSPNIVFTKEELLEVFAFAKDVGEEKAIYNLQTGEMDSAWMPPYYRS